MKHLIALFVFCFLISGFWLQASAQAACVSPTGIVGDIIYNANYTVPQYCNGGSWVSTGPNIYEPIGMYFNGGTASSYLSIAGTLAGAAAGKMATGSFWFKRTGDYATQQTLFMINSGANNPRFNILLTNANVLRITAASSSSTTRVNVTGSTVFTDSNWHHVAFSFNDSAAQVAGSNPAIYVDDVAETLTVTTFSNGNIDFAPAGGPITVGVDNNFTVPFAGYLADFWLNLSYVDLSVTANRRYFINASKLPVDLGLTGSRGPTGSAPLVYLYGAAAAWNTNKGTGGGFTLTNGPLTTAGYGPSASARSVADLNEISSASFNNAAQVAVSGSYAYVGGGAADFDVVNVSTPSSLSLTGHMATANTTNVGGIAVSGTTVFLCSQGAGALVAIDVTTPSAPAQISTKGTSHTCYGGGTVAIQGNYAYTTSLNWSDMNILDISNPAAMVVKSNLVDGTKLLNPYDIAVDGNYAYVSSGVFTVIDVTSPTAPAIVGNIASGLSNPGQIAINPFNRNILYVGGNSAANAVHIIDVTTKTAPAIVGSFIPDPNACTGNLTISGRYLYVSSGSGALTCSAPNLHVYDISNPTAPVLLTNSGGTNFCALNGSAPTCGALAISGNNVYMTETVSGHGLISFQLTAAACSSPSGNEGDVIYNSDNHVMQYCNGSAWQPMGPVPGAGGGGCSSPAGSEHDIIYNSGKTVMQYCDGTSWIALGGAPAVGTTTGLAGWWKFDETSGSTASDSSGNGNTGTLNGSPTWAPGMDNGALTFVSTINQYVDVGNAAGLNFERTQPFSIAAWIYVVSPGCCPYEHIVTKRDTLTFQGIELDDTLGANAVAANIAGTDSTNITVESTPGDLSPLSTWHHVVMTYDGSSTAAGVKIYVDGVNQTLSVSSDNLDASILTSTHMVVGRVLTDTTYFNGSIDDVRVYNRVLSASEVSDLYHATGGQ